MNKIIAGCTIIVPRYALFNFNNKLNSNRRQLCHKSNYKIKWLCHYDLSYKLKFHKYDLNFFQVEINFKNIFLRPIDWLLYKNSSAVWAEIKIILNKFRTWYDIWYQLNWTLLIFKCLMATHRTYLAMYQFDLCLTTFLFFFLLHFTLLWRHYVF